jgi:hypothetical protein
MTPIQPRPTVVNLTRGQRERFDELIARLRALDEVRDVMNAAVAERRRELQGEIEELVARA